MRISDGGSIKIPSCINDADCKLTLHRNCRNTKEIAELSVKPLPHDKRSSRAPSIQTSGKKPHIFAVEKAEDEISYVNKAIDRLKADGYENIVILTMNTLSTSILSGRTVSSGSGDYNRRYLYDGKEYLFSNCSKFKGLEADAIILIDVNPDSFENNAMYFYVGTSRARMRLELVAHLTPADCGSVAKLLDPKSPAQRNPVWVLKKVLSCEIDVV
jgi:DNA helicase IV